MRVVRRWAGVAAVVAFSAWLSALGVPPKPEQAELAAVKTPEPPPPVVVEPPRKIDCKVQKCIALTFDDGPMEPTSKLLGILAQKKVRATFFVVGRNVVERPEIVREMVGGGHELANHSYTHADLGRASRSKVASELGKTQDAIKRAAGVTSVLMRPPYGSTDKVVAAESKRLGLAQVLWTVDPSDWQDRDRKTVERRVVAGARPGYIVLMHDIHSTTVAAVPKIIERLAAEGFVFVTVSELYGRPLIPGKKYTKR